MYLLHDILRLTGLDWTRLDCNTGLPLELEVQHYNSVIGTFLLSIILCNAVICDWIYENRPYRHKK